MEYHPKKPDQGIEARLQDINWKQDQIVLFVGRLIKSKGIHAIIAALPFILEKNPRVKLVVVGHGPLRELLEILLWALENGARELVKNIIVTRSYHLLPIHFEVEKCSALGFNDH